jgi:hypothetical protein
LSIDLTVSIRLESEDDWVLEKRSNKFGSVDSLEEVC